MSKRSAYDREEVYEKERAACAGAVRESLEKTPRRVREQVIDGSMLEGNYRTDAAREVQDKLMKLKGSVARLGEIETVNNPNLRTHQVGSSYILVKVLLGPTVLVEQEKRRM